MLLIKLKFTGNRFVSTCCSEDVEMHAVDPKDMALDVETEEASRDDEVDMGTPRSGPLENP
jgi:hypothetical protein